MLSASFLLLLVFACLFWGAESQSSSNLRKLQPSQSITDIAIANSDQFSVLVAALDAAGLASLLSCSNNGCQQFTVFAPVNSAFSTLDSATNGLVTALATNPAYRIHLRFVLLYHLLSGVVSSDQVPSDANVPTALGPTITTRTNPIRVNEVQVIQPFDVRAANGIIHSIDQVLLPPFITKTTPQVAAEAGIFSTLLAAVEAAGLVDVLSTTRPYTLLAPTNDAFAKLGDNTITALLNDPVQLASILQYHVIVDQVLLSSNLNPGALRTAQGSDIIVTGSVTPFDTFSWEHWENSRTFTLNDSATILIKDVFSQNGIIHAIDTVLIPPTGTAPQPPDGGSSSNMPDPSTNNMNNALPSIADIVVGNPDFSTLATALSSADLVALFDDPSDGPYTVLAPTNAAFAELGQATIESLLAGDPAQLASILQYHVVPGSAVPSTSFQSGRVATALPNQEVDVQVMGGIVLNGNTNVVAADVMASNGIVHVIDKVLIPLGNIVETAQGLPEAFSTLVDLVVMAGLAEALSAETSDITVFAPTNEAFSKVPAELVAMLTDPANQALLQAVLTYHVVPAYVPARNVALGSAPTLQGESIDISANAEGGVVLNGNSNVVQTDVFASNGVIHVIDTVLLPPSIAAGL